MFIAGIFCYIGRREGAGVSFFRLLVHVFRANGSSLLGPPPRRAPHPRWVRVREARGLVRCFCWVALYTEASMLLLPFKPLACRVRGG